MSIQKQRGTSGEDLAVNFLKKRGYEVVAVNYFSQFGELDVVAKKDDEYVFVEVKTRTPRSASMVSGEEAVSYAKRRKMLKTIQKFFLQKGFLYEVPWRCDVIVVMMYPKFARIVHYPYAFELSFY